MDMGLGDFSFNNKQVWFRGKTSKKPRLFYFLKQTENENVLSKIRYKIMCNFCQITPNIMQRIRIKKFMKPTSFSISSLKGTN